MLADHQAVLPLLSDHDTVVCSLSSESTSAFNQSGICALAPMYLWSVVVVVILTSELLLWVRCHKMKGRGAPRRQATWQVGCDNCTLYLMGSELSTCSYACDTGQ